MGGGIVGRSMLQSGGSTQRYGNEGCEIYHAQRVISLQDLYT